jgi:dihydroorotate dehydrogenase
MYSALRPLIFRLDPEIAHSLTLNLVRLAGALVPLRALLHKIYQVAERPVQVFGLSFRNPVGLAAGYDKDGLGWRGLACLGFGHIEIGTVTPLPQPGNPRPRLFRLQGNQALINRMGFPGRGAEFVAARLAGKRPAGVVLGVNLGKNKDTPLDHAVEDYLSLMSVFSPLCDYLAINVSSPNTVGLRRLQARQALSHLLQALMEKRSSLVGNLSRPIPLLVKLSPDLDDNELDDALDSILAAGVDGVIATNTTINRDGLTSPLSVQVGGLSGMPLRERSTKFVRKIYQHTSGRLPIIGVGGVMNADDAKAKLDAGAVLVQIYTGLIYSGPGLVKNIVVEL